jgi:hypothetical protein
VTARLQPKLGPAIRDRDRVLVLTGDGEFHIGFNADLTEYLIALCDEPCKCSCLDLEFKIKKEASYNYEYKGLRPQPHYA